MNEIYRFLIEMFWFINLKYILIPIVVDYDTTPVYIGNYLYGRIPWKIVYIFGIRIAKWRIEIDKQI